MRHHGVRQGHRRETAQERTGNYDAAAAHLSRWWAKS
jgi:hypothetical protein